MRKKFVLPSILVALLVLVLSGSAVLAAEAEKSSETVVAELPRLEDYADQNYMLNVYHDLEKRVPKEPDFAKEWAFTKFVIDRNGKVEEAVIANSTGGKKFDAEILKILHETHLPPLPEDCPDRVRATHAFNYHRATRGLPSAKAAAEESNKSEDVKQFFNKFGSRQSDATTDQNAVAAKNSITNSLLIFYAFFILMFMGGGSVFAFFVALPVWYLHRLFTGRFPT